MNSRNLPRQALATGLAACAHLLVLLLLGWKVPRLALAGPAEDRTRTVEITLFRPIPRARQRPRTAAPDAPPRARPTPRSRTAPTPGAPVLTAPPQQPPPTPAPAAPDVATDHDRERLGSVLRGLTGCADPSSYRLSREERAACDRRLAAAPPAPVQRQFDAKAVEQFNSDKQESIFTRKPHNGCLPGIGDRPAAAPGVQVPAGATTTFGPPLQMVVLVKGGRRAGSRLAAAVLAVGAHLLALLALGWRAPRAPEPRSGPEAPPLQLSIVRPRQASQATAAPAEAAVSIPSRAFPPAAEAPTTIPPPTTAPDAPSLAGGAPDCQPEDLVLLTEAEKARCRNQIDADRGRRLARGADERLARQVAGLKAVPRIESIPAEKRAYYDAVAAAYEQQTHGPPMAGRLPGLACGRKTPYHSLKLGPLPCAITPPQGFLTEEAGIPPP